MAENESKSSTAGLDVSKSRLRPPSKLKRPMSTPATGTRPDKPIALKKIRNNAGSAVPAVKQKKVTTRRSFCRVRNGSVAGVKKKPLSTVSANAKIMIKKQIAPSSTTTGKAGTSKSKTVITANATDCAVGPKKAKRPSWDIKGKLADMTELYERQHMELTEHKQKTKVLDDILRRLDMLEGEKQAFQVENTDQQGEISKLRSDLSNSQLELHSLREKLRVLLTDLDARNTELGKLRLENQDLNFKYCEQEGKVKDLSRELQSLEGKYASSQSANQKYEEDIKDYEIERKRLLNEVIELKGNIRVFCRVRPPIKDECSPDHIVFDGQKGKSINVANGEKTSSFAFDKVFNCKSSQAEIFEELSQLVNSSLDGYNVCVFAYGQTGSGKTYTMEGPDDMSEETCGVIPRAMNQVFLNSNEREKFGWKFTFHVEQLEIYCENVQDLLRPKNKTASKLEIKTKKPSGQSGIWVPELSSHKVETYSEAINQLGALLLSSCCNQCRLFNTPIKFECLGLNGRADKDNNTGMCFGLSGNHCNPRTRRAVVAAALNLIDLAGSERCGSNGSTGMRFTEGTKINNSLTVLSTVITALSKKDSHVPFRSSKLTLLLSDCLGGNSKTLMIVNINPSPTAAPESINTLRFATTVNQCNIGTAQKVVKF